METLTYCEFVLNENAATANGLTWREPRSSGRAGILAARIAVDPSRCSTKFGAWLASKVATTRRGDDLSIVRITLQQTEEELHWRELAKRIEGSRIGSDSDFDRMMSLLEGFIEGRKGIRQMYCGLDYSYRCIQYEWPVLGSRACGGITDPQAYFDFCAGEIRRMRPIAVKAWDGEEAPASLKLRS